MDAESFKRRFLPFHAKLFRIAYALLENKEDAEDVLQDVYFKLWTKRHDLEYVQNPEAFCVTLVKNACLDFMGTARWQQSRQAADVAEAVGVAAASTPEQDAEARDQVAHVQQLIRRLPDKQRQVLRLRSIDDCSMDEIGRLTGLTQVNIRVLLARARKTLREQLKF